MSDTVRPRNSHCNVTLYILYCAAFVILTQVLIPQIFAGYISFKLKLIFIINLGFCQTDENIIIFPDNGMLSNVNKPHKITKNHIVITFAFSFPRVFPGGGPYFQFLRFNPIITKNLSSI